jgi:hypothetical protein
MTLHQPVETGEEHRVLRFRPRTLDRPPRRGSSITPAGTPIGSGPDGLARYAHGQEAAAEYRHRMLNNLAAAAFAVMLTLIGIWLANRLADLRNAQDCVLMGRRDCAHIKHTTTHINMSSSMFRE